MTPMTPELKNERNAWIEKNLFPLSALEGSEKQIAWAEEIRIGMFWKPSHLRTLVTRKGEFFKTEATNQQFQAAYLKVLAELNAEKQASFWIENREQMIMSEYDDSTLAFIAQKMQSYL